MNALLRRASGSEAYALICLVVAALTGLAFFFLPASVLLSVAGAVLFVLLVSLTPVAALVFLLVLAPFRALLATESQWPLPLDTGQLLVLIWGGTWLFHHLVVARYRPRLTWSPVASALAMYLVAAVLSLGAATSVMAWLGEWLKWLGMLVIVVLVATGMQGTAWRWALWGLLLAGVVNALIGLYQFFGGSGALHLLIGGRFFRAFGTFGQPNPFGGFMAVLLPVAACLLLAALRQTASRRGLPELVASGITAATAALLFAGLIASWSRGAWVACGAALIVILLALPRRPSRGLLLAGGAILAAAVLWTAGLLPASITARLASSTEDYLVWQDMRGAKLDSANYPVVERLAHWQAAINMATEHPWTGVGLGNYEQVYNRFNLINWPDALGHAHNYWLNQLAETGIPGLVIYVSMWCCIFFFTWRARQHPDPTTRLVIIGLLGAWTSLAVHSLFDNLFVNNLFLHIGTMLGILAVLARQSSSFQDPPARMQFR